MEALQHSAPQSRQPAAVAAAAATAVVGQTVYACHASLRGVLIILFFPFRSRNNDRHHHGFAFPHPQAPSGQFRTLLLTMNAFIQTFQVPIHGLRDGHLGNDLSPHLAEKSLSINLLPQANEKHLASPRPQLHLPPRLVHVPDRVSVGDRIYHVRGRDGAVDAALCVCAFLAVESAGCQCGVFGGGEGVRPAGGYCRVAW